MKFDPVLMAMVRRARSRARSVPRIALPLMAARIVSFLFLGLTVAACSSLESTPSDRGQASLVPSTTSPNARATATAELSQIVEPTPPAGLGPDDVAQVVTTDLVVRSAPGTGDDSAIYQPLLTEPTLLYIVAGPVAASGYQWYLAQPFGLPGPLPQPGWVAAAGRDGEAWIAPASVECGDQTTKGVIALPPEARLACYGDSPLTLEGRFGGCDLAIGVRVSPVWLNARVCHLLPVPFSGGQVAMRSPREIDIPTDTTVIVEGHFDDPAAQTCIYDDPGEGPAPPAELVVFQCRTEFVATRVSIARAE